MAEAASKMRGSSDAATRYKMQLEGAGFVNVQEIVYKWPTNRWPKDSKYKELGNLSPQKHLRRPGKSTWLMNGSATDVDKRRYRALFGRPKLRGIHKGFKVVERRNRGLLGSCQEGPE